MAIGRGIFEYIIIYNRIEKKKAHKFDHKHEPSIKEFIRWSYAKGDNRQLGKPYPNKKKARNE